jgi:hypothetical protein
VTSPGPPADLELLCPACGYDLRAATSDLCPECGLQIDRSLLQVSGVPWAHRNRIGRIAAYLKTVWLVTIGGKSLRYEASRRQDARDARRFARITALIIAVAFVSAIVGAAIVEGGWTPAGLPAFAIQPSRGLPAPALPGWVQDLAIPWCAGAVLPPVLPIAAILFAFALTALPRAIFRASASQTAQQSAAAIASYVTSPLVFLLPAVALMFAVGLIDNPAAASPPPAGSRPVVLLLGILAAILVLFASIAAGMRIVQWIMRTRHCGLGIALLGLAELLGLWVLAAVAFVGLLPWCVGYVWIVIDSFR